MRQDDRGFTLLELIVVMVIITALAAILFPVIIQARNRASAVTCLSNLKQLGSAVAMYSSDYDGRLPRASGSPFAHGSSDHGTTSSNAASAIWTYVKSARVLACPNDNGAEAFGFPRGREGVFANCGTSYLWNTGKSTAARGASGASLNTLGQSVPLFQDYGSDWHGTRVREGLRVLQQAGCNAVYADGRAAPSRSYTSGGGSGHFAATVSGPTLQGDDEYVTVAGDDERGHVYLQGQTHHRTGDPEEGDTLVLDVSGTLYLDEGDDDVTRTFTFSATAGIGAVVQQAMAWAESLISQ
jgi:prepilin-type N-terminal cleavage/methylation domain-containing protein